MSNVHDAKSLYFNATNRKRSYGGRFGTDIGDCTNIDEAAAKVPGFTDRIAKLPISVELPGSIVSNMTGGKDTKPGMVDIDRKYATVNERTGARYGVVGEDYEVCQWDSAFLVPRILQQEGKLEFDAAGTTKDGAKLWMSMKIDSGIIRQLDGSEDALEHYLLFSNAHTGKNSVIGGLHTHRFSCSNALATTIRGMKTQFRLSHRGNLEERIAEAHGMIVEATSALDQLQDTFQALALKRMTKKQFRNFAKKILDEVQGTHDEHDGQRDARDSEDSRTAKIDELEAYFGSGNQGAGATAWGAYQTITGYLDAKQAERDLAKTSVAQLNRHFESTAFGKNHRTKSKALNLLLARK
jgi:phage/plasmid-like protein (TIGR03299 family)